MTNESMSLINRSNSETATPKIDKKLSKEIKAYSEKRSPSQSRDQRSNRKSFKLKTSSINRTQLQGHLINGKCSISLYKRRHEKHLMDEQISHPTACCSL
eukprot:403370081